jgi:hypothetical protein
VSIGENIRREGIIIQIISEVDFWDCIEDVNPRVLELLAPSHSLD